MSRMGEYHAAVEARDDEIRRLEGLVDQGQARIRYLGNLLAERETTIIKAGFVIENIVNLLEPLLDHYIKAKGEVDDIAASVRAVIAIAQDLTL